MITRFSPRRLLIGGLTAFAFIGGSISVPLVTASLTPAMAQSADEMQEALENYGHWVRHARYGEVWVPDGVPPDWRPYEYGHWVYTDDWGWYWISDESEDDWGWVVYHYGRWGFDREIGWFWVRGDDWAPAWVDWRYGGDEVGWAPLPPDDAIDVYEEQPEFWAFVPLRYMGEERLRTHYYPRDRRVALLRSTRIVNRPVHVEGRRIWVNPGLAPGFIAGRTHVALHAYQVRPRVFSRTTSVQGAVTVRKEDLRIKGAVKRSAPITVQRTTVAIQPTAGAPAPQPLNKKEPGRLGPHVPRAAQGVTVPPGGSQDQQQQNKQVQPQSQPNQVQPQPQPKQVQPQPQPQNRQVQPQPQPQPKQVQPQPQPQPKQVQPQPQPKQVQPQPQPQNKQVQPQPQPQPKQVQPQPQPKQVQPPPQPQNKQVQPQPQPKQVQPQPQPQIRQPPPQPQQRAPQPPPKQPPAKQPPGKEPPPEEKK
jgi:hypothetical protein